MLSNTVLSASCALFYLLVPQVGMADVFEQGQDGIVKSFEAQPQAIGVAHSEELIPGGFAEAWTDSGRASGDDPSLSSSAVILDSPATQALGPMAKMPLPKPGEIGRRMSVEQQRMRRLAIEIASAYARHPAVVRARLAPATFVALFTAMIRRESNYNPRAVSPAGAKGLGQLMPKTARELGVCDIFTPRQNLEGAATYLTQMLSRFGSPSMALAAYNAGPEAVAKHRGIPPYRETRQYVSDIIRATELNSDAAVLPSPLAALAYNVTSRDEVIPPDQSIDEFPLPWTTSLACSDKGDVRWGSAGRMNALQEYL